jgi:hypothetical protein
MAAPVVQATATTNITTAASTWVVNLPASIAAGDALWISLRTGSPSALNAGAPAGWTTRNNQGDPSASDDDIWSFSRTADGAEGATVSIVWTTALKGATLAYRCSGVDTAITTDGYEIPLVDAGTAANLNPSNIVPFASGGASKDFVWILNISLDGETQTFTSPTNYSAAITANSGTVGAAATNVRMGGCWRTLTAATEDPGAWTHAAPSNGVLCEQLVVYPAAGAATEDPPPYHSAPGSYYGMVKHDRLWVPERWREKIIRPPRPRLLPA